MPDFPKLSNIPKPAKFLGLGFIVILVIAIISSLF